MAGLTIRTAVMGSGLACVSLDGVLDGRTSSELEREVAGLLERGPAKLAFDLGRLDLMTSAGAGVFVGAVVMVQERGGALALIRPCPAVRHVIDVLGLTGMLPVADDLRAAAARIEELCSAPREAETA